MAMADVANKSKKKSLRAKAWTVEIPATLISAETQPRTHTFINMTAATVSGFTTV